MKYNPDIHHRRSIRLKGYDYSKAGAYFITVCTQNRECLFGEIPDGQMVLNDAGRMVASVWDKLPVRFDHIELDEFVVMPNHFHGIFVLHCRGEPCVRPDSDHDCKSGEQRSGEYKIRPYNASDLSGDPKMGEHKVRPYVVGKNTAGPNGRPRGTSPDTVGRIVQAFKSITKNEYIIGVKQRGWPPFPGKLWQRNYYEHIIRNENELNRIREYIISNPMKWKSDRENPDVSILETPAVQWDGQS